MSVPEPWEALLLALATFRLVRLAAWDDLTHGLRMSLTGLSDKQHHELADWVDRVQDAGHDPWSPAAWREDDTLVELPVSEREFNLSRMLRCPHCIGFHLSVLASLAWYASPHWTLLVALPFALSTVIGWSARWLEP